MLPLSFLAVMLAFTGVAFVVHLSVRQHRSASLRNLAAQWQMNYSEQDPFHLLPRVVERFPVPGASNLHLIDLIYRQEAEWYRYLFTVEFTIGVVRTKKRVRQAVSLSEPRDRGQAPSATALAVAPAELPLIQQYIRLHVAMTHGKDE